MTKQQRVIYESLPVLAFVLFGIISGMVRDHDRTVELSKNSTIVVARITKIEGVRGYSNLFLSFPFRGRLIETIDTEPYSDSVRVGSKVRIRVGDSNPEHMRYIGVEQW